jgi:hypothetical protein
VFVRRYVETTKADCFLFCSLNFFETLAQSPAKLHAHYEFSRGSRRNTKNPRDLSTQLYASKKGDPGAKQNKRVGLGDAQEVRVMPGS